MLDSALEACPGCTAMLPVSSGPTHRYIGASAACWSIFSDLFNGGQPPIAPVPINGLLGDAYAAQHPGTPSAQAIQSAAVHLLTLHGVLERGVSPDNALWVRRRAFREQSGVKHGRFQWLTPPSFSGALTIVDIVRAPTSSERTSVARRYIDAVWTRWSELHHPTIARWYDAYVIPG